MKEITIGRSSDNTIVLDDTSVSRHHCRCYEQGGVFYVQDCKSTNGVLVDGEKVNDAAEFVDTSKITVGKQVLNGADLIKRMRVAAPADISKCKAIDEKYRKCEERYANNVQMLLKAARIEDYPYTPLFASDDERVSYMVQEYERKMGDALDMLRLISKSSQRDAMAFRDDMDALSAMMKSADPRMMDECVETRQRVYDVVGQLQKSVGAQVAEAFDHLNSYYGKTFAAFYETSLTASEKWNEVKNDHIVSVPYLLTGRREYKFPFFEQAIEVRQLQFSPFLKRGNLVVRCSAKTAGRADYVVNGVLGRLMASSQSGNMVLHVVDMKDLGGTSNMLKMLDRHVFSICARTTETQALLSALDEHVEDVVQNLLQGEYDSIRTYNHGKEKQEPYHIVVFRNFPFGVSPESAHTVRRILVNGIRSGVHFIFMVNNDFIENYEECRKTSLIMRLDEADALNASVIDLTADTPDFRVSQLYEGLDEPVLHKVVQQVNAGFEMKKDEVLRLTDYMIPDEEWWSRMSARRVDIPFGMSTNKQIQRINITQESGQNAAVVIGIPGSGKSVFLHVMIASAMVNYSPKELQMYLLDFSGVEFDVYARHKLPHARVIAPEAEREFGISIIREVYDEGLRRMNLCRDNKVTNIVELKQQNPDIVVPRLLVIIDEFQKLFEVENDKISQEANKKIHAIIQEYRKFGINLILATQKLPAKSVIPYDLIANRVVFKSDPNDFNNLIRWPHSMPQPRLLTGNCVYNDESGSEVANHVTRSFFINASGELETLLDKVAEFGKRHPELVDNHELRTFRSDELPEFSERIMADSHVECQDLPREVGVYVGEGIEILPCHVYVPLTSDSNNNILIIGGQPHVAKGIAYSAMLSEIVAHSEKSCSVIKMNFMTDYDPMRQLFESDVYAAISEYCNMQDADTADDVLEFLRLVKEQVIDVRKSDPSNGQAHLFINIFDFQRGRMFDGTGGRGDMQSECSRLLEYILKNGPMVGVYIVLQVDNLANLSKLGYGIVNQFDHRIALQMSEKDSDKVVGNSAANRLLVQSKPSTAYRGLYYNVVNNSITKFKPYNIELWHHQ